MLLSYKCTQVIDFGMENEFAKIFEGKILGVLIAISPSRTFLNMLFVIHTHSHTHTHTLTHIDRNSNLEQDKCAGVKRLFILLYVEIFFLNKKQLPKFLNHRNCESYTECVIENSTSTNSCP